MKWFGYVWVAILVIMWLIWTIKCVIDLIRDIRSIWKLSFYIENGASWFIWAIIHICVIFVFSLIWFIYYHSM